MKLCLFIRDRKFEGTFRYVCLCFNLLPCSTAEGRGAMVDVGLKNGVRDLLYFCLVSCFP